MSVTKKASENKRVREWVNILIVVQDGALKWTCWTSSTLTIGLIRQAIAYDVVATNNLLPPNYLHGFTFRTSKRLSNSFGIVVRVSMPGWVATEPLSNTTCLHLGSACSRGQCAEHEKEATTFSTTFITKTLKEKEQNSLQFLFSLKQLPSPTNIILVDRLLNPSVTCILTLLLEEGVLFFEE